MVFFSVLKYCVPNLLDSSDSLKTFLKNNKIVPDSLVDGSTMVEWMSDTKEVNKKKTP